MAEVVLPVIICPNCGCIMTPQVITKSLDDVLALDTIAYPEVKHRPADVKTVVVFRCCACGHAVIACYV